MVVGIGDDVLEPVMSAVRNPPEGAAALRGGDLARPCRGNHAARTFDRLRDHRYDRYLKSMRETILSLFDITSSLQNQAAALGGPVGAADSGDDEASQKLISRIKELIPTRRRAPKAQRVSAWVA